MHKMKNFQSISCVYNSINASSKSQRLGSKLNNNKYSIFIIRSLIEITVY